MLTTCAKIKIRGCLCAICVCCPGSTTWLSIPSLITRQYQVLISRWVLVTCLATNCKWDALPFFETAPLQLISDVERSFYLILLIILMGTNAYNHEQTNSYLVDHSNQSIKLSKCQAGPLLIPVSFLPSRSFLGKQPLKRDLCLHLYLLKRVSWAKMCFFWRQTVETQTVTMEASISILIHQIWIWSILHFLLNDYFSS